MVEGRQRAAWRQTAEVCRVLAEGNRDSKEKTTPYTWQDFFPYADDEPQPAGLKVSPVEMRNAVMGW